MNGLLFITHRTERYTCLQSAVPALEGGCRQIQLRLKDASSPKEVETVARSLKTLCDDYGADLYVNDHVEVCKLVGARGVHLGKQDMSPVRARALLGDEFIIGGTANTFDDILRLNDARVDYIGLGPFRFTSTKQNIAPTLGTEGYRSIIRRCRERNIRIPIVAIGGITAADIAAIMSAGVSGVALSSSVLNADDPAEEMQKIINIIYG